MIVLIIFPVILQTDINVIMLSIGGQGEMQIRIGIRVITANAKVGSG